MFDVGFTELMVIAVVALIVIGPERLPGVARTVGHLLGRAQRYVNDVKSDINREMQLEELKKLQSQVADSARNFEQSIRDEVDSARTSLGSVTEHLEADLKSVENSLTEPTVASDAPALVEGATPAQSADVADSTQPVSPPASTA